MVIQYNPSNVLIPVLYPHDNKIRRYKKTMQMVAVTESYFEMRSWEILSTFNATESYF
jgi:hypothetical protein